MKLSPQEFLKQIKSKTQNLLNDENQNLIAAFMEICANLKDLSFEVKERIADSEAAAIFVASSNTIEVSQADFDSLKKAENPIDITEFLRTLVHEGLHATDRDTQFRQYDKDEIIEINYYTLQKFKDNLDANLIAQKNHRYYFARSSMIAGGYPRMHHYIPDGPEVAYFAKGNELKEIKSPYEKASIVTENLPRFLEHTFGAEIREKFDERVKDILNEKFNPPNKEIKISAIATYAMLNSLESFSRELKAKLKMPIITKKLDECLAQHEGMKKRLLPFVFIKSEEFLQEITEKILNPEEEDRNLIDAFAEICHNLKNLSFKVVALPSGNNAQASFSASTNTIEIRKSDMERKEIKTEFLRTLVHVGLYAVDNHIQESQEGGTEDCNYYTLAQFKNNLDKFGIQKNNYKDYYSDSGMISGGKFEILPVDQSMDSVPSTTFFVKGNNYDQRIKYDGQYVVTENLPRFLEHTFGTKIREKFDERVKETLNFRFGDLSKLQELTKEDHRMVAAIATHSMLSALKSFLEELKIKLPGMKIISDKLDTCLVQHRGVKQILDKVCNLTPSTSCNKIEVEQPLALTDSKINVPSQ